MNIKLNGKSFELPGVKADIVGVLKSANVEKPDLVSVQLNGEFVEKTAYPATEIKDGDDVDFLYFMGGGTLRLV